MKAFYVEVNGRKVLVDAGWGKGTVTGPLKHMGYNRHSWEAIKLPGPMYSNEDMITSLKRVKAQSEKENCAAILAAHNPEIKENEIIL